MVPAQMTGGRQLIPFEGYQAALANSVHPFKLAPWGAAAEFTASIDSADLGGLTLIDAFASAPFHCRAVASARHGDNGLILILQEGGETSYLNRGRHLACGTGKIAMLACDHPIEGDQHGSADALVVRIPSDMVSAFAPGLPLLSSRVVDTSFGSGRLLAMTLRELRRYSPQANAFERRVLPGSLLRLVEAAFHDADLTPAAVAQAEGDAAFGRLRACIIEWAGDPELSVASLARRFGMSRTRLYDLVRSAGTTVERLIFDTRLDLARARLDDPACGALTLTEVAFAAGFQDMAHFSRRFRSRFGCSPTDYRRSAGGDMNAGTSRRRR